MSAPHCRDASMPCLHTLLAARHYLVRLLIIAEICQCILCERSGITLCACSSLKMSEEVFIQVGANSCSCARLSSVGALPVPQPSLYSSGKGLQYIVPGWPSGVEYSGARLIRKQCWVLGVSCPVSEHHWSNDMLSDLLGSTPLHYKVYTCT